MPVDPKAFWTIANGFPLNKEEVYPEHATAQNFDGHKGKIVLEYGCGGGSDTLSYLRRGCSVIYADIVPANVLKTQRAIAAVPSFIGKAKPLLLKASAEVTLPDAFVDVVNAHGVIHHIANLDVRVAVIDQFNRVLKPGGRLYIMLYTEHLWDRCAVQVAKLTEERSLTQGEAFGWCTDGEPCPYATAYDEENGRELLEGCGFSVESTFVYNNNDFRTFRCIKA